MGNLFEEARKLSQDRPADPDPLGLPSPGVLASRMHARREIVALRNEEQLSERDRGGCLSLLAILIKLNKDDIDHVPRLEARLREGYIARMKDIETDTLCSPALRAAAAAMREELERTS